MELGTMHQLAIVLIFVWEVQYLLLNAGFIQMLAALLKFFFLPKQEHSLMAIWAGSLLLKQIIKLQ